MISGIGISKVFLIIHSLLLPTIRVLSAIISSPIFGDSLIDRRIKIILSVLIVIISNCLLPAIEGLNLTNITIFKILEQFLIGIFLGLSFKIIFIIAIIIGELVSLQIGLSFSVFFDFHSRTNISVMSKLFNVIVLLIFLSLDGHLWMIFIITKSFEWFPINYNILDKQIFFYLLRFFCFIFFRGFIFVFPLIVVILILNCMMAILNKMSSQFSIFSVMFSITLLLGILFYCYFSPIVIMYFINLFSEYFLLIINSLDSYKNIFLLKY